MARHMFKPFNQVGEQRSIERLRRLPYPDVRYVPKHVNGIFTVFDQFEYRNLEEDQGSMEALMKLFEEAA
jgi:hypothetical protein